MTCDGRKAWRPVASACSEKALFFAHADCWAITNRYGISTTQLYKFATQTQRLVPWRGAELHSQLLGLLESIDTEIRISLASLLHAISRRLPPEIQQIIMDSLQRSAIDGSQDGSKVSGQNEPAVESSGSLFTQLAVVQSQTVTVLKQIRIGNSLNCHASRSSDAIVKGDDEARSLFIRTRNILCRAYISDIGINKPSKDVLSIPISSSSIIGLRFSLGRFGLRAICILYEGGSHSPWLGDPSGCWFGNVRGSQLESLHTTGDGRLQLSSESTPHSRTTPLTTQQQCSIFGLLLSTSTASPFVPMASATHCWIMKLIPLLGSLSRSLANALTRSRPFSRVHTILNGGLSRVYRSTLARVMQLLSRSSGMHEFSSV